MELICGACQGRLLVEMPGTTVACPHCGTHLQTPAAVPAPQPQTAVLIESDDGPASGPDPTKETVQMDAWAQFAAAQCAAASGESFPVAPLNVAVQEHPLETGALVAQEATPVPSLSAAPAIAGLSAQSVAVDSPISSPVDAPVASLADTSGGTPADDPLLANMAAFRAAVTLPPPNIDFPAGGTSSPIELPTGDDLDHAHKTTVVGDEFSVSSSPSSAPLAASEISAAASAIPSPAVGEIPASNPVVESAPADAAFALTGLRSEPHSSAAPLKAPTRANSRSGISPTLFMAVLSYASAVTLACLYLAFQLLSNPRTHDLPDLAPPKPKDKKKVTTLIYLSPDQELPPANVLKLGESRQYGSLKVTPLSVTRGPLEFEYYEPEANQHKDPEGPVLKLHLRFENVSSEQEFTPLDSKLVFSREIDKKVYGLFKANNWVCNVADRKDLAKQVLVFDLTPNGNWLVKDENLDRELEPGQVLETFIPTTSEQIETLKGDLVWRVHFRKGYNRASYRGVTTLIEVPFKDTDISDEPALSPATKTPDAPAKKGADDPAKLSPAAKDA